MGRRRSLGPYSQIRGLSHHRGFAAAETEGQEQQQQQHHHHHHQQKEASSLEITRAHAGRGISIAGVFKQEAPSRGERERWREERREGVKEREREREREGREVT